MLSNEMAKLLSPFSLVSTRGAMLPQYRAIMLSPDVVRACASYGILEVYDDIGVADTVFVSAVEFLTVVRSLPSDHVVKLVTKDSVLHWSCGPAHGRLACLPAIEMPVIPAEGKPNCVTTKEMGNALAMGGLSCNANALVQEGIYGVVMDSSNYGYLTVASTDSTTLSAYEIMEKIEFKDRITLPPPGAELLAEVIEYNGSLEVIGDKQVIYRHDKIACIASQVKPLRVDVVEMFRRYDGANEVATMARERSAKFIQQAIALAEVRKDARITLSASAGRIILAFESTNTAASEFFLVDGLDGYPDIDPVSLSCAKLARALTHTEEIVLDYVDKGIIVLRGGAFSYVISGQVARE
jgi:DNA polymerase III sliding clamp (beta) subunit (PCNA family)